MSSAQKSPTPAAAPDPLDEVTANEMVYLSLKDEILSNRLRPGSKLVHQSVAERLGVSRTPVRESLERLYQEGLLFRIKNRGYYVAEIDAKEVADLYETRLALELHTLGRLFEQSLAPADLARLEALHAKYGACLGVDNTRQRTATDRDFHLDLARIAGNQYLHRMLEGIFERLMLKRRVEGYNDTGERAFAEHTRFLEALKAGDRGSARAELTAHIQNGKGRLIRHLASLTGLPSRS
jgi:DNA-binding GntR family transcriptional regulator